MGMKGEENWSSGRKGRRGEEDEKKKRGRMG